MGRYDAALSANQQGWRDQLAQESPLNRFMASLRQGQETLTKTKDAQWLRDKFKIEQEGKADELARKEAMDQVNADRYFAVGLSNAVDPEAYARASALGDPDALTRYLGMAKAYTTSSGKGPGAEAKIAGAKLSDAAADAATVGADAKQAKLAAELAHLDASTKALLAKVSQGWANNPGMEKYRVVGSPEWARYNKYMAERTKLSARYQSGLSAMGELESAIGELETHPGLPYIVGNWGKLADPLKPGARDAENIRQNIVSRLGMDTLARLKSETGASLGSVTEAEHRLLQGYVANLEREQTIEGMRRNLGLIRTWIARNRSKLTGDLAVMAEEEGLPEERPSAPGAAPGAAPGGGPSAATILNAIRGGKAGAP